MALDRTFVELNHASTDRIRALAARLSSTELQHPVGEHWTIAIVLVHLAFWDRRVLDGLEKTERAGKLTIPEVDLVVNDLSLPFWAAIPPRKPCSLLSSARTRWIAGWKTFRRHCSRRSTAAIGAGSCVPCTGTSISMKSRRR